MQTLQFNLSTEDRNRLLDIQKSLENLEQNFQPKQPPKYYTRQQLAKLFDVNISTIHNWKRSGILESVGIGSRVYFTQEAVDNALVNLKH
jgi:hypothetical protein